MADREEENDKEREVEKALHLLLLATPTAQSHILEHSATASWAKTFLPAARGATLFCFLVLLMTFCRTDVDIMLNVVICQPASQPRSTQQVPVQGTPQGVSAPPTAAKTLLLPACSSHCSFIRRPLTCRQAGSQEYIPSTGITTKALPKKSC